MRWCLCLLVCVGCGPSAATQVARLKVQYDDARAAASDAYSKAKTPEERETAAEGFPDRLSFAEQFLTIAEKSPRRPAAYDAAAWVLQNAPEETLLTRAIEVISRYHSQHDDLRAVLPDLERSLGSRTESLLRDVSQNHPQRATQGVARLTLAKYLLEVESARAVFQDEVYADVVDRYRQMLDEQTQRYLETAEVSRMEVASLLEEVIDRFHDVPARRPGTLLGDLARRDLFELEHLAVGMEAPEITGEDIDGTPFKLSDFRGKIVVLKFWGDW